MTSTRAGGIVPAAVTCAPNVPLEVLRRLDDRAVAREVRHRREDVHLLRARDARDALERDRRGLARGEELGERLVALRLEERHEQRALAEPPHLGM